MSGPFESTPRRSAAPLQCGEVRELLALVPGADLPVAKDRPVRDHLADCPACRQQLGGYVRARRALRTLTPDAGAEGFAGDDNFFADLRRETLARVRWDRGTRRKTVLPRRRSITALLTGAALFLLGVYLVPQWLPAPEIVFPEVDHRVPTEFHDGYGLSGHQAVFDDLEPVPLPEAVPSRTGTKR